jgi:hypothetical protein
MLDASDALHAHTHCRALMVHLLKQPAVCMDYVDFKPQQDCRLLRFIHECEAHHGNWPEIAILRTTHTSFHALATDMARRCIAGEHVDVDAENAPHGRLDNASAAVVAAVWRVERKLHTLAG